MYFLIVATTTVGFGDVFCVTILGRMSTIVFLLIGPVNISKMKCEFVILLIYFRYVFQVILIRLVVELFFYQSDYEPR